MRNRLSSTFVYAMAMLLLVNCAATTKETKKKDYSYSAAEQRMREKAKNFDKTVWQGVLIGAAGGAASGGLLSGDWKGAAWGAAGGGIAGGLGGLYIADKQKKFATREEQLNSMIGDIRNSNKENEEFIASVQEVLKEDRRRLDAINQKYEQGAATKKELEMERERTKDNQVVVEDAIKGAKEKLELFEKAQEEYKSDTLAQEIQTYEDQMSTLDALADAFASA